MGVYSKMKNRIEDSYGSLAAYQLNQGSMDTMQSSENQAALSQMRDLLNKSNEQAAAQAAITGASLAAQALAKQQSTESLAQATQGIASSGSQLKRNAMQGYYEANIAKNNAMNDVDKFKKQQQSSMINAGISAAGSIASKAVGGLV